VSGKHYYALRKYADDNGIKDVAFVRVEQLCPFPTKELQVSELENSFPFVTDAAENDLYFKHTMMGN
jgi:2-oxoglutarate dehydrogenase complex dehydrogenase (E1) component-like enzyme